jgi:hypothetical protein
MANQDTAFGLRPIGLNGASVNSTGVTQYEIATNETNVIYQYSPVSVDTNFPIKAFVADNPNQLFMVAADASVTDRATAIADVFKNCSLANATSGSTNTGNSTAELDISTAATTATLAMRIVGLSTDIANLDYDAAGTNFVVRFNFHFNSPASSSDSQTTADSTGI